MTIMIEEVFRGIFKIELPMPDSALQSVNCYLLKGKERDLIIDSGINTEECKTALEEALQELNTKIEKADFFITHMHEDHFGLAPIIASNDSTIYLNFPEALYWGNTDIWKNTPVQGKKNGFPTEDLKIIMSGIPAFLNKLPLEELGIAVQSYEHRTSSKKGRIRIIEDGETLNVGEYSFRCMMTPGHSSGHTCLYEPRKNILFSGDHILETITPAIFHWAEENRNPLHDYLNSLDQIFSLEIDTVLPGHRGIFQDYRGRISELKEHHKNREREIASVIDFNGKSAYEIASQVSWNIDLPWEQFTPFLKWMALAETLAHLKYMEHRGKVKSILQDNEIALFYPLEKLTDV